MQTIIKTTRSITPHLVGRNVLLLEKLVQTYGHLLPAGSHDLWDLAGAIGSGYSLNDYGNLLTVAYLETEHVYHEFLNRAPFPEDEPDRPHFWNNSATFSDNGGMQHTYEIIVRYGDREERVTGELGKLFSKLLVAVIKVRVHMHRTKAGYPAALLPE